MRSNPARQRLTAWLLIACIIGMLSSGLAHALAGSSPAAPWQEICSLTGVKQIGGDGRQDDAQTAHVAHCAFCSKFDHAPALPSQAAIIASPRLREPPPTPSALAWPPVVAPRWAHRPRGPPTYVAVP